MREWVSVEDRLPDDARNVLVFSQGRIFVANYNDIWEWWFYEWGDGNGTSESDFKVLESITHWMPLPKPPEAQEGKE